MAFPLPRLVFLACLLAAAPAQHVSASPVDFVDTFDGNRGLSQWGSISSGPIPNLLGDPQAFSLFQSAGRSVAGLVSVLPPNSARGFQTVTSFAATATDVTAVFSPTGGIDGIFNLCLIGDRGPGYVIKGGVFGANYGVLRFADAFQGWGLPYDPSGDGFIREASEVGGANTTWNWEYGHWYELNIQLRETSTTVSIHGEGLSTPGWSAVLPRGYSWLGNSFKLGMVQNMYIPAAGQVYLADAAVDSVRLVTVPEPASIWPSAAAVLAFVVARDRCCWLGRRWTSRTRRHAPPVPA
jgi:hypothetical protein